MHLLVYSRDAKQGWLTKKGIDELRSVLGNDIFRMEQYKLFTMETDLRDRLKKESQEEIEKLLAKIRDSYAPTSEVEMLFLKLVSQLKTCKGRKQYLVWAHFSETSTETMEDKIKRMLREEVRQMMAQE